jgi:hypothetical protein
VHANMTAQTPLATAGHLRNLHIRCDITILPKALPLQKSARHTGPAGGLLLPS